MKEAAGNPYHAPPLSAEHPRQRSSRRMLRILVPAAICLVALLAVPLAFIAGGIVGQSSLYERDASHQQSRIQSFLDQHPDRFGQITVERASNGWAYPMGTVASEADYELLNNQLQRMFGDELAARMIVNVEVKQD